VGGGVAEAGDLRVLRDQVVDRVVDEVGDGERPVDAGRGEVADRDADRATAGLGPQPGHHGLGQVDAVHRNAALGQRQGDAAGADPELEGGAVARQPGEYVHDRRDGGRVEHVVGGIVVAGRDILPEVVLGHATL
jgi:hypothetical protein